MKSPRWLKPRIGHTNFQDSQIMSSTLSFNYLSWLVLKDLDKLFLRVLEQEGRVASPKNRKVGFPFVRVHLGTDCEGQARIRIHGEEPDFSVHSLGIHPLHRKWSLNLSHLPRERKSRENQKRSQHSCLPSSRLSCAPPHSSVSAGHTKEVVFHRGEHFNIIRSVD